MEAWTTDDVLYVRNALETLVAFDVVLIMCFLSLLGWAIVGRLMTRGNGWGLTRRND